jgi:phytoene dehydrogenase-like protein
MGHHTAIVAGGGPAGLVAAIHLARGGADTVVLEAKGRPGGRAASDLADGFTLNQGPHALYLGGPARRHLRALGIDPPGRIPPVRSAVVVDSGRVRRFPAVATTRAVVRAFRARPADLARISALEWAGDDPVARTLLRVATYTGALDRLSADAAVAQLRLAARGVRYLHGGWQALVDTLHRRAEAEGVRIVTGAPVRRLHQDGAGWTAVTDDGEHHGDVVVVAAGGPVRAARLLETELPPSGPEAEATVLDLGLHRLPRRGRTFAPSLEDPLYLSVHAPTARVAPDGKVLVSLASYGRAPRATLEAHADTVQPGWRDEAILERHLPAMSVISALPVPEHGGLAGRPGPAVPGLPGAFLAGDWVGPEGLLLDAAVSSAVAAARAALAAPRALAAA